MGFRADTLAALEIHEDNACRMCRDLPVGKVKKRLYDSYAN
jgi:hypothetical protein